VLYATKEAITPTAGIRRPTTLALGTLALRQIEQLWYKVGVIG